MIVMMIMTVVVVAAAAAAENRVKYSTHGNLYIYIDWYRVE